MGTGIAALAAAHGNGHRRSARVAALALNSDAADCAGRRGCMFTVFHIMGPARDELAALKDGHDIRIAALAKTTGLGYLDSQLALGCWRLDTG